MENFKKFLESDLFNNLFLSISLILALIIGISFAKEMEKDSKDLMTKSLELQEKQVLILEKLENKL